jgi:hypothetical protein
MKPKKDRQKKSTKGSQETNLLKNPSYKNMVNPYESKYPQPKKPSAAVRRRSSAND